jgi:hypothetical protein
MPQFSQRPRGLLEPYAGMTGTYGSEGGPPQQCGGPTRRDRGGRTFPDDPIRRFNQAWRANAGWEGTSLCSR